MAQTTEPSGESARDLLERLAQVAAEPWGRAEAEAWWREHGEKARAKSRAPSATAQTIQVDLGSDRRREA